MKWAGELLQTGGVGGESDVVEIERRQELDHRNQIAEQERLTPRDSYAPDAGIDKCTNHRLPRRDVERGFDVAVFFVGPAVDTGEIAAVGERKTHTSRGRRRGAIRKDRKGDHARSVADSGSPGQRFEPSIPFWDGSL